MTEPTVPRHTGTNQYNSGGVLTDTGDMLIPHSIFRGELAHTPASVRSVTDGDAQRASVVAGHVHFVVDALARHHGHEDKLLWPRLHERIPRDIEPVVDLMESQHAHVHELVETIDGELSEWVADPSGPHRVAVAKTLDAVYASLNEHLSAEEREILPVAARNVSQAEWDAIGEEGMASIPKDQRMLALGEIRYFAPAEQSAAVVSKIPRAMRPFIVTMADRAFRKEAKTIYGTAKP